MQVGPGGLNVVDDVDVGLSSRLFKVTHEAMHGRGVDNVRGEQQWYHHHLGRNDNLHCWSVVSQNRSNDESITLLDYPSNKTGSTCKTER